MPAHIPIDTHTESNSKITLMKYCKNAHFTLRGRVQSVDLGAACAVPAVLQVGQSQQEQRQEEAAERRLRKASKEVLLMRGEGQKEPLPVHTFRYDEPRPACDILS